MMFIDGGYFVRQVKDLYQVEEFGIAFNNLINYGKVFAMGQNRQIDMIRTYYYDAKPEDEKEVKKLQKDIWDLIDNEDHIELRFGRLKVIKNKEGQTFRQKGVDTKIAIDMLSKAYENHYDIAVLLAGDDDFLDVVKSVKNAGKRVYGIYFEHHISKELKGAYDNRRALNKEILSSQSSRIIIGV
jgi:uncharacterized LabA/DUF88 family protein